MAYDKAASLRYRTRHREKYLAGMLEWKRNNKEHLDEYNKQRRTFRRHFMSAVKLFIGCERCGYRRNPAALDFHHIDPATKLFTIGQSSSRSPGYLAAEMLKCDVICANCHREIEDERRQERA